MFKNAMKEAILVLEDGSFFTGINRGTEGEILGEVVFNTALTGYQEILTDPSYKGQIVVMTYPHIGNYGANSEDVESRKPFVEGFVVRELSNIHSNWRAEKSIDSYLKEHNIIAIEGIDTRRLTRIIRIKGAMKGIISTRTKNIKKLLKKVKQWEGIDSKDLVKEVTSDKPYKPKFYKNLKKEYRVVVIDCGVKYNILRLLESAGLELIVVPAFFDYKKILSYKPDGIFISNGPGNPFVLKYVIETIKNLLNYSIPTFGICLGHQLLGLALGGRTFKLKFGHHGANHPVKNLKTGDVEITSQNHNYAVDIKSIEREVVITHINLNDKTLEGMKHKKLPLFSVQYHPEASPGPHDSVYLFDQFKKLIAKRKKYA